MSEQVSGKGQTGYYAGLAAAIIVVCVALWFLLSGPSKQPAPPIILPLPEPALVEPEPELTPEPPAIELELPEPVTLPEPTPVEPAPAAITETPLPSLEQADSVLKDELLALDWRPGLASLLVTKEMVRNFVVTVDNLAQGRLVTEHDVLKRLEQGYRATATEDGRYLAHPANTERYEPYLLLLESVPPAQLKALKQRYKPLLEQAFAELGYENLHFDQRLQQAIALLLATPELQEPPLLERPSVYFTYADPQLEQLPEAQKQMLRLSATQQQRARQLLRRWQQTLF